MPYALGVDGLTLFGAAAVALMLTFYALEPRSPHFVLAFAAACVASSAYGFLQGAWPFGVVEAIWSVVALRRWWARAHNSAAVAPPFLGRRARRMPERTGATGSTLDG